MSMTSSTAFEDENGSPKQAIGDCILQKTVGAGNAGKIKLAIHSSSGKQVSVKIVERSSMDRNANVVQGEMRAIREATISMLLHHPHICAMREIIVDPEHYYMVGEYFEQSLLDFIIMHGRLKEKVARKFARQIGSALDYCHCNNVVHRDLRLENIHITPSGDIKVVDFGLSNLYGPSALMSTICGHYFAAPEILSCTRYAGPGVDVWSFGVVLYTLVCGRVPFDGETVSIIHDQVMRGCVSFPRHLSAEGKSLLTSMLVIDPATRMSLFQVLRHPWIVRGYGPPQTEHRILARQPLKFGELEERVLQEMKSYSLLGDPEDIEIRLSDVLISESYIAACQSWERRRDDSFLSCRSSLTLVDEEKKPKPVPPLDSYYRSLRSRLFDLFPAKWAGRRHRDRQALPRYPEALHLDPTAGFHPLISFYHLAKEKMDRE